MPRVKKIIQARDGGPIPVAYSEVEVGGETVLAPVVVLEAGAQVQLSGSTTVVVIDKDVTAAATPEAIGTGTFNGTVRAKDTNTSTVYLGDATTQVAPLQPGEERELVTGDLSGWYCRVSVDGEGVYLTGTR